MTVTYPQVTGDTGRKMTTNHYSDCSGRLDWSQDEEGHKTYYEYDSRGRVIATYTDISGQSAVYPLVKYVYEDDDFGRQTQVITHSDANTERIISYTYDDAGRVTKIIYPYASAEGDLLGSDEFKYDEFGKLMLKMDGNSHITAYAYDELDRLTGIDYEYAGSFNLPISGFSANVSYSYDGLSGRVRNVTEAIGQSSYAYDRRGRLKSYKPAVPANYGAITYEYNSIGQKTAMTVPLGTGWAARKFVYAYDNTGKQTGMEEHPAGADTWSPYESVTGDNQTHFWYDDAQNRVKMQTKTGGVYYFVYDPTASIPAVVYEQGPEYRYLNAREPDGSLVSREKYQGGTRIAKRTYHFDGLGSTVALTDEEGDVTDTYKYDAWGNVTDHGYTGTPTADNPYQYVGQLGYYTHYQEPTFGLLQLGVRYYDPTVGRFTSRDPVGEGVDWYAYAGNDPIDFRDPSGLAGIPIDPSWPAEVIYDHLQSEFDKAVRKIGLCHRIRLEDAANGYKGMGGSFVLVHFVPPAWWKGPWNPPIKNISIDYKVVCSYRLKGSHGCPSCWYTATHQTVDLQMDKRTRKKVLKRVLETDFVGGECEVLAGRNRFNHCRG